jgi:hypothetical protein
VLNDFLYEAIFIPDGVEPPPHDVILTPPLNHYVKDFERAGDSCFVCEWACAPDFVLARSQQGYVNRCQED